MVEFNIILREFSGSIEPGWWITDDNCAYLQPEAVSGVLLSGAGARVGGDGTWRSRGATSIPDDAMGHLLEMQQALGLNSVNYGPTVDAGLIREKMPDAVINGQLPPFLLRDGSPQAIRERIIEDFRKAGTTGLMNVTTAGSLAAGARRGRMRRFMQVVQESAGTDRPFRISRP